MNAIQPAPSSTLDPRLTKLVEEVFSSEGERAKKEVKQDPEVCLAAILLRMKTLIERSSNTPHLILEGSTWNIPEARTLLGRGQNG